MSARVLLSISAVLAGLLLSNPTPADDIGASLAQLSFAETDAGEALRPLTSR